MVQRSEYLCVFPQELENRLEPTSRILDPELQDVRPACLVQEKVIFTLSTSLAIEVENRLARDSIDLVNQTMRLLTRLVGYHHGFEFWSGAGCDWTVVIDTVRAAA